jgi:hypothetical protein
MIAMGEVIAYRLYDTDYRHFNAGSNVMVKNVILTAKKARWGAILKDFPGSPKNDVIAYIIESNTFHWT